MITNDHIWEFTNCGQTSSIKLDDLHSCLAPLGIDLFHDEEWHDIDSCARINQTVVDIEIKYFKQ